MVEPATPLQSVKADQLREKLRSKEDWYKFLKYTCKYMRSLLGGYMLPSAKKLSMRFVKDFLAGKKQLLKASQATQVNVPQYPELALSQVFELMKSDAALVTYLDWYDDSRDFPERWYFYNVLATLYPDYLDHLIKRQTQLRVDANVIETEQQQLVTIRPEVLEALSSSVSSSSKLHVLPSEKSGKAWAMVKARAKPRAAPRKRKLYEIAQVESVEWPGQAKTLRLDPPPQKQDSLSGQPSTRPVSFPLTQLTQALVKDLPSMAVTTHTQTPEGKRAQKFEI